jgi:hypothetical protein
MAAAARRMDGMRASPGVWLGLALALTACGSGATKPIPDDAGVIADGTTPPADASATLDGRAGPIEEMTDGARAQADAPMDGLGDAASEAAAADTPAGSDAVAVLDATADAVDATAAGPGDARSDLGAAACSPAPDQRGFYSSCSACPNPADCDTIDVNGNRRYACGCSSPCPCNLHCGSYVIPGAGISIGSICVR